MQGDLDNIIQLANEIIRGDFYYGSMEDKCKLIIAYAERERDGFNNNAGN